jgi:hypothetical protein
MVDNDCASTLEPVENVSSVLLSAFDKTAVLEVGKTLMDLEDVVNIFAAPDNVDA